MNRGWHQVVQLWLLHTVLLTLALPALGPAWHRVLPHEHVFVGNTQTSNADALLDQLAAPTANHETDGPDPRWVHLPDPAGLVQVFAFEMGLFPHLDLPIPSVFTERLPRSILYVPMTSLSPLDPPPIAG